MEDKGEDSYYHCGHCTEEPCIQVVCPLCDNGLPKPYEALENLIPHIISSGDDREKLFNELKEKYDWGYIDACEEILARIRLLFEELKDGSKGTRRD